MTFNSDFVRLDACTVPTLFVPPTLILLVGFNRKNEMVL